jgi:hypothetical protein
MREDFAAEDAEGAEDEIERTSTRRLGYEDFGRPGLCDSTKPDGFVILLLSDSAFAREDASVFGGRTAVFALFAAALVSGCHDGSVSKETKAVPVDAVPSQARKLIPRSETKLGYGIVEAGEGYQQEVRSWGRNSESQDGALQKRLDPHLSQLRVIEGWVGKVHDVKSGGPEGGREKEPVIEVAIELPELFLARYPVLFRAENYDRESGYATIPNETLKRFVPGTWVKFTGVLQPDSEAHWETQGSSEGPNRVWLGTLTLTDLERIE